jgi:AcrR family transcriptional regulator
MAKTERWSFFCFLYIERRLSAMDGSAALSKVGTKKKQKRQSLLDSAFTLFNQNSFSKTSISDIVEKAGVAKGTFYLYFHDKNDILDRLIENKTAEIFRRAYDAMKETDLTDFEDKVIFIIDYILDKMKENKSMVVLTAKNLGSGLFRSTILDDSNAVQDTLHLLMEECDVTYHNGLTMLYLIVELVGSASYNVILHEQPLKLEDLKPALYQSVRAIMGTFRSDRSSDAIIQSE